MSVKYKTRAILKSVGILSPVILGFAATITGLVMHEVADAKIDAKKEVLNASQPVMEMRHETLEALQEKYEAGKMTEEEYTLRTVYTQSDNFVYEAIKSPELASEKEEWDTYILKRETGQALQYCGLLSSSTICLTSTLMLGHKGWSSVIDDWDYQDSIF